MKPSLVSVVIPTYNRARDLQRALRSVRAQTYPHWEAVVVDNYSTDGTEDVARSFEDPRIILYKIHNDGVIAASRNLGIRKSRGEYIAFLDSDDWWSTHKLEESVKYLDQGADAVYHDLYLAIKSGQRFFWRRARTRDLRSPVFRDLIANGNALNNSSIVVRRHLLTAINGLAEDRELIAIEDYDACLRIAQISERFKRIPRVLGYYWAGGGATNTPNRVLQALDAIEAKHACAFADARVTGEAFWVDYSRGRAYYRLGAYDVATRYIDPLRRRRIPFSIRIKSHWMLLSIRLYDLLKH